MRAGAVRCGAADGVGMAGAPKAHTKAPMHETKKRKTPPNTPKNQKKSQKQRVRAHSPPCTSVKFDSCANVFLYPSGTYATPWCASVESAAMAVDSCPPPRDEVETKRPADLPWRAPVAQSWPVASQKVCGAARCLALTWGIDREKQREGGGAHLPLGGEVPEAGGDAEEEGVELGEVGGCEDGVGGLGGCVELLEDVLGEGLCDPRIGDGEG